MQSVAVRIIVDRENEIRSFVSQEYWSVDAKLLAASSKKAFPAKLSEVDGEKVSIGSKEEADKLLERLKGAEFIVTGLKKSQRKKQPAPPFTTSTLQQEASRRYSFQSRRTMKAAQELYEGIDVAGMGAVGLITYMRTDSLRISDEAKAAAADLIKELYGAEYLPEKPRVFKSKNNAQDAHEAIRPTTVSLTPDKVKASLSSDQYKLYKLIWERFIASQMANALLDTVAVDINAANCLFKASGFTVKFDGFTVLYEEAKDSDEENSAALPPLETGGALALKQLTPNQHFTQPPARYTEASLIKTLEENGIGRPEHLRADDHDDPGARLRRAGGQGPQADRAGRGDDQADGGAVLQDCRHRLHRQHGEEPRRGRGGQGELYPGARRLLWGFHNDA